MEDSDFEPINSSSKLGLLFGANYTSSDKSLLRYNGEKEQIEKTSKTTEKPDTSGVPERSDKPIFACLVSAKRINDGSVTSQEKIGLALLKTSSGIFELFLYKDMKNILWRTIIQPDSEYKILGEHDVMIEDPKSSSGRWKIKFRDTSERTDFLSKVVLCRAEIPSVQSHPSLLKQKVVSGSEEITLNKTMRIRIGVEEYGKGKIADLEKNLFEWDNGQNFLEGEGIGCVFVVAHWESQLEELNIPHGALVSITVEEIVSTSLEFMQRKHSSDQIDGKKMSDVEVTPKHTSLKNRMSNIGYATPLVAAGSSDSLTGQKDIIVNNIDPTLSSRPSSSLQIRKSFPINNSEPGPSSFKEDVSGVSAKIDLILKMVTSLDAAREISAQNFNFIDPFIILSSINKIVDDNRTLKEEVKEKQGKIENLSEKLAELALALKTKVSDGGNKELYVENQKLIQELEESQVQRSRMDEQIIALNLKVSSLDGQCQEKHRETEELKLRITSLDALLKTKEYEIGSKLKAELETRRSIEYNLKETKLLAETAMNSRDKLATHVVQVHRKHSLEIQKTREECTDKIKKIMNQVYKKLIRSFQPQIQYSGDSIKTILKECVREVTLTYVDSGEKSGSSCSDISQTPKNEVKVLQAQKGCSALEDAPANAITSELTANEFKSIILEPSGTITTHQDPKIATEEPSRVTSQSFMSELNECRGGYQVPKNVAKETVPKNVGALQNTTEPKKPKHPEPKKALSSHQELRKSTEGCSKVVALPIISDVYGNYPEIVEEESFDIPPVKRFEGSELISPLTHQAMFGDGLSHVSTPEILPEPSLPVVVKKPLGRYSGSPVFPKKDILSERCRNIPPVSNDSSSIEKSVEPEDVIHVPIAPNESSSVDKSTELREAINVKIAEGVREYTPEPPPPPEFVIDSDSESDWLE